ncbi:cytochrome c [Bordetella sp. BOR01]|uniref:cytochrome c n=1 Tax=Bordetella sp. BOR01 TaxID=2854779 RepID=UPI001C484E6D|nr:cytochrome c [Bordetella sp. BOR01]MBV7483255.1 c-type cytochrome [Bordetella sp. BOR01]
MSRTGRIAGAAAVVVVAAAAVGYYAWQPAIAPLDSPPPISEDRALLAQGARLAELGDCMHCHTAQDGKPYAGGLPLNTPFGTIYSTNITPDVDTGIGAWSQEAFARAMRRGVARDGSLLYPAFPYVHFTRVTDDDIAALYAYLMARRPVHAPAPANELTFPLNFRPLVAGWNLLFLDAGELPAPAKAQSKDWLRGRYLVEGLGHCASCHTPMNALGAEKSGQPYAGGLIDGWEAPPLNALTRARRPWTHEQLTSYLHTGLATEHGAAAGPMLPVTQHLANVPLSDVQAMATYLMSMQPEPQASPPPTPPAAPPPAPPGTPAADDAQRMERGAATFNASCASCHGASAPMHTVGGRPLLELSTALNADSPRNAIQLVLSGNPWTGSASAHYMPPFAATLTDEQIADVLAYTRVQYAQRPAWKNIAGSVAAIRKENPQP